VDVNDLVRRHAGEITRAPDAALALELELDARDLVVWGDVDQLLELFRNLTDNARAAMPAGGTLRLRTRGLSARDAGRPEQIQITFEDTGTGIGAAELERMFEPHAHMRQKGRGRGLGLAIVAGVVRRHQGTVEVASSEGEGTTVTVTLPAAPPDVLGEIRAAASLEEPAASEGSRERVTGGARVPQA
jgi:signal transduction histidine kinase